MLNESSLLTASPARIPSLSSYLLTSGRLKTLYKDLYKRYLRHNNAVFEVNGVKVYSYYVSQHKTRVFYSLNLEEKYVNYYSQLKRSSTRNILDPRIKGYYQSLVYTNDFFGIFHQGFAQAVIWEVMFPYFIDSLLITDKKQTDAGFKMWKRLLARSYIENIQPLLFIYNPIDKQRYVTMISRKDALENLNLLDDILFGDNYLKFSHRGIILLKKADKSMLEKNTKKMHVLNIEEFIKTATTL